MSGCLRNRSDSIPRRLSLSFQSSCTRLSEIPSPAIFVTLQYRVTGESQMPKNNYLCSRLGSAYVLGEQKWHRRIWRVLWLGNASARCPLPGKY